MILGYLLLATLWAMPGSYWGSTYHTKWIITLIGMLILVMHDGGLKRIRLPWGVWAYTCISAIRVLGLYGDWAGEDRLALNAAALGALASFMILTAMPQTRAWDFAFRTVAMADAAIVFFQWLVIGKLREDCGGPLGNPSMNASLLMCLLPLFWVRKPAWRWMSTLPLAAALLPGASIPLGVLVAVIAGFFLIQSHWLLIISAGLSISWGMTMIGPSLFQSTGRFELWGVAMNWWKAHANPFLGTGLGTGQVLIPWAQYESHQYSATRMPAFPWMHNDWLQVLFEMGVLGLVLYLLLFCQLALFSWYLGRHAGKQAYLPMLLGYGVMSFFNYPAHLPLHAVFGAWLAIEIFAQYKSERTKREWQK